MQAHAHDQHGKSSTEMQRHHYRMLAVNLIASLIIMYVAMFAMIWSWGEFIQNVNFLYMALVMWAPMSAVMLLTMKGMYGDKRINLMLYALFAIALVGSFYAIRAQSLVGDRQFLRSMIPHHSGAILMCERSQLRDAEIRQLCGEIIKGQQEEIDQMKTIMARLGG